VLWFGWFSFNNYSIPAQLNGAGIFKARVAVGAKHQLPAGALGGG